MSITSESSRADYTGNGTQSVFSYAFKIFKEADLLVTVLNTTTKVETTLTISTDYTISGVGETAGGNVTLVDAGQAWLDGDGDLDTGYRMSIRRVPDVVQETDIRNQGQYFPEVIEDQFDKQTFIDQKQQDEIDRSIKLPETQTSAVDFDTRLPADLAGQADKSLVTNSTGDGFDTGPSTDEIAAAQQHAIDADEHKQTAERWANLTTDSVTDVDTGVDSGEYSAKAYAIGGTEVTETAGRGAAKEWATKTDNPVDTVEYSAKEYAQGTQTGKGGSSKQWAQETASDVDSTGEYSAKEYAQGVQAGTGGSSKDWAQETASDVDGVDYSAKEYAQGIQTRGLAGGGSAKDWAQYTASTVDDTEFSAKKYAADAAASAAAAATNASASLWQDTLFKVFGDSPISIVDSDTGKMFAIDCSGGNVVVNLPSIATLTLTGPWSVGIQKSDSSSNTVTINANGTDEIDGAASLVLTKANATATLLPDTDPTPDQWTPIVVGEYPVTGALVGDTDTQTLTGKTMDANNNTFSNFEHGAEVDNPSSGVHGVTGSVVGTTDTQDLSGKTFTDALTFEEQGSTPSTPATGDQKIYPKSDNKWYTLNDAGEEVELGSGGGSGQGGINYIQNPDADVNLDNITDTANVTVTQETAIRGDFSAQAAFSASMTTGDHIEYGMDNVELADKGKALFVSFDYSTGSNTVTGDFEVVLRNTTGGVDIVIDNGNDGILNATGGHTVVSKFTGKVDLDPAQLGYTLRIQPTSAIGAAREIRLDRVTVGPDTLVPGAIVTELSAFTPTGSWVSGNETYTGHYRRVGDCMEVITKIELTGAPTAANLTLTIPDGLTIDTTKINNTSAVEPVGDSTVFNSGVAQFIGRVYYNTSTTVAVSAFSDSGTNEIDATVSNVSPFTFGSSDAVWVSYSVPIEEWTAGAQLSTTESFFSTAKLSVTGTPTGTLNSSFNKATFPTEVYDTHSSYSSGTFTAPKSGKYLVSSQLFMTATFASGDAAGVGIYKNSSQERAAIERFGGATGNSITPSITAVVDCEKGDTIEIYGLNDGTTPSYSSGDAFNYFHVEEMPDFSTFSVFGETEYIEVDVTSRPVTTVGNTAIQSSETMTVSPGKWMVGYSVSVRLDNNTGGTNFIAGAVALYDDNASSILVETGAVLAPGFLTSTNTSMNVQLTGQTEVILTEETVYKMDLICTDSSAQGALRIEDKSAQSGNGLRGGADTNAAMMWARRIS